MVQPRKKPLSIEKEKWKEIPLDIPSYYEHHNLSDASNSEKFKFLQNEIQVRNIQQLKQFEFYLAIEIRKEVFRHLDIAEEEYHQLAYTFEQDIIREHFRDIFDSPELK